MPLTSRSAGNSSVCWSACSSTGRPYRTRRGTDPVTGGSGWCRRHHNGADHGDPRCSQLTRRGREAGPGCGDVVDQQNTQPGGGGPGPKWWSAPAFACTQPGLERARCTGKHAAARSVGCGGDRHGENLGLVEAPLAAAFDGCGNPGDQVGCVGDERCHGAADGGGGCSAVCVLDGAHDAPPGSV